MIQVGQTIGNYTIAAKLGEGGMGVVYLAEHPVIGRKVAMKAIHPELARNPEVISRFMNEAKSVNQIGNEHIVDVMDYGKTPDGEFYFIMEYLQGEALADRLRRESILDPVKGFQIACQVADALAASHAHGIIHRDLKPENIYLIHRGGTSDFVKVLDFGLAKLTQGDEKVTHKTRTGSVMGTPYYMAPEQCEGKANIDHRADVYSLGVIVFEMLTGRVPFGGEGYGEIIVKHITMPPPSPRSFNSSLTMAHEAVLLRALEKNRETRFQSMDEFRAAMVDPVGYLAGAPRTASAVAAQGTTAAPSVRTDDDVSGAVVFGDQRRTAVTAMSGPRVSQPSTFRDSAGEIVRDAVPIRSNKGIVAGVLGAAAVAGLAAFFVLRDKPTPTPVAVAALPVPSTKPPAAAPAAPKNVKIAFSSTPEGAAVTRKDTGKELGKTPFDATVEAGATQVAFVFTKEGFSAEEKALAPVANTRVDATLKATPGETQVDPPAARKPGHGSSSRAKKPAPGSPMPPAKPTKKPGRPMDEDGVLEPSFK